MSSLQIFKKPKIKAKTMQLCNAAPLSTFFLKSFEYSNLVKHLRQAPAPLDDISEMFFAHLRCIVYPKFLHVLMKMMQYGRKSNLLVRIFSSYDQVAGLHMPTRLSSLKECLKCLMFVKTIWIQHVVVMTDVGKILPWYSSWFFTYLRPILTLLRTFSK